MEAFKVFETYSSCGRKNNEKKEAYPALYELKVNNIKELILKYNKNEKKTHINKQ